MGDEMVMVENISGVDQHIGIWVLKARATQPIPVQMLAQAKPYVRIVSPPRGDLLAIYRSLCKPGCGHSLCSLTRGVTAALEHNGFTVNRADWRRPDQPQIGRSHLCNSGTFEGPAGKFAWPHPDADICARAQADYFRRSFDGHICSSEAIRAAMIASGIPENRCHVVNDAIDVDLFTPDGPALEGWPGRFVFLMLGALNPRKGFDLALEAYGKAFTATDPVVLALKDYDYGWGRRGWCQEQVAAWQARLGEAAPMVEYVYTTWDEQQIAAAYRRAAQHGAYLMPSRCEGFGLTGAEAIACGCRVGMTGWSGQLDYATPENATLFAYTLSRNEANPQAYERDEQPKWAEAKVEDIIAWMSRVVVERPDRERLRRNSEQVRAQFTYERMAEELASALGLEKPRGGRATPATEEESGGGRVLPGTSTAAALPIAEHETLGIGIPTRGRPGYVAALLGGLFCQTKRPDALCLVDDDGGLEKDSAIVHLLALFRRQGTRCGIVPGSQKGASPNHQIAMEWLETDLVLRLDDDLIPASPDYVERLYRLICGQAEIGAVGGTYPKLDEEPRDYRKALGKAGMTNRIEDMRAGRVDLQFRNWQEAGEPVEAEHLYSSWIYRRAYLEAVGGFPDCYSRFGQREETDASVRLCLLGGYKLLVDPGAKAWHFLAQGGRRPEQRALLARQDVRTFEGRLKEWRHELLKGTGNGQ